MTPTLYLGLSLTHDVLLNAVEDAYGLEISSCQTLELATAQPELSKVAILGMCFRSTWFII